MAVGSGGAVVVGLLRRNGAPGLRVLSLGCAARVTVSGAAVVRDPTSSPRSVTGIEISGTWSGASADGVGSYTAVLGFRRLY